MIPRPDQGRRVGNVPLIVTCLWMWYLIVKKAIDMYSYTRGWRPVQECINNAGKADFKCAVWQKNILDGFMKERTDRKDSEH